MSRKIALAFTTVLALGSAPMAPAAGLSHDSISAIVENAGPGALSAFAQARKNGANRRPARDLRSDGTPRPGNPVHRAFDSQGRYLGADPDPHVRLELERVPPGRGD